MKYTNFQMEMVNFIFYTDTDCLYALTWIKRIKPTIATMKF